MKTPKNQNSIKLNNYFALTFSVYSTNGETPNSFEKIIKFGSSVDKKDKKKFTVIFDVELKNETEKFNLDLMIQFNFVSNKIITKKFENSSFFEYSAPAIAFPYVRAMITSMTINAGLSPIVLPTYNFTQSGADG